MTVINQNRAKRGFLLWLFHKLCPSVRPSFCPPSSVRETERVLSSSPSLLLLSLPPTAHLPPTASSSLSLSPQSSSISPLCSVSHHQDILVIFFYKYIKEIKSFMRSRILEGWICKFWQCWEGRPESKDKLMNGMKTRFISPRQLLTSSSRAI